MDTKQLYIGNPKEGIYPIVQDTVTVIELNEAVMSLTSESSSEDIAAAFDTVEGFNELIENVRNSENIVNGILMNNENAIGKIICTIYAYKNQYACDIEYIYDNKIIRLDITNTDGTLSCIRTESNLGGDKTNVLILSLENDLANGQKNSPVDAEVSTALKDAISTGKACVIKSTNSDILANLQQIGDNVTIVMEQISRVGQTFVAVNTTITVNTATNVISDYQTGAIVLETEGDGSKFLSDDGTYKEINTSSVIIPVDLKLNETLDPSGSGYDFSQIYNAYISGKTVYLKDSLDDLYLVINASANHVAYYAINTMGAHTNKPTLYHFKNVNYGGAVGTMYEIHIINDPDNILYKDNSSYYIPTGDYNPATKKYVDEHSADMSNYLAKDNTTEFTPTSDYQPATKKYVDDSKEIVIYDTIDDLNADKENLEIKIVNGEVKAVLIKNITFENNSYIAYTTFLVTSVISNGMVIVLTSNASVSEFENMTQYALTSNYHADYVLSKYEYYKELNILHKDNDEDVISGNFTDIHKLISWNKVVISDNIYSDDYIYPLRFQQNGINADKVLMGWDTINGNLLRLDFNTDDRSCTQTKTKMPIYTVLTESEYAALGTASNTDNVLYFITPD